MSANKGPDWYNETDIDKMHMLAACSEGRVDIICDFIDKKGVLVDEFDDDRTTALQIAAAKGHVKLSEYLIDLDADLESCNVVGYTPLLHACREGNLEVVKLLLQRGAKLDVTTFTGASPLTLACAGGHFELVKYLISLKDCGVEINPKTKDSSPSPLLAAAFKNQPVISSCLVSRGARVDYVMPQYALDILSCVVMCSSATMFSTLLDLGAKPEIIRNYKNSNIDDLVNICGRVDIWRVLQDYRRQKQRHYPTTVDIRTVIQEGRVVELIDLLAHPEKWTKLENSQTPLMYAVIFGQTEALRTVIDSKSDLNVQESKSGLTALMIAAILGNNEMITMLLYSGAKVSIKCDFGWTALDFAYHANGMSREVLTQLHKRLAGLPLTAYKKSENPMHFHSLNRSTRTLSKLLQRVGLAESGQPVDFRPREEFLSGFETGSVDIAALPDYFTTADDILRGDNRRSRLKFPSAESYLHMVRNIAHSWYRNAFFLKPFALGIPFYGDYERIVDNLEWKSDDNMLECDGHYSTAQKYCALLARNRYSTTTSVNSLVSSDSSPLRKLGIPLRADHLHAARQNHKSPQLSSSANAALLSGRSATPLSEQLHSEAAMKPLFTTMNNYLTPNNNAAAQIEHIRSHSTQSATPAMMSTYDDHHQERQLRSTASSPRMSKQHNHERQSSKPGSSTSTDTLEQNEFKNVSDVVAKKLKSAGCEHYQKYADAFREQEVDISTLLECTREDLAKILKSVKSPTKNHDVHLIQELITHLRHNCVQNLRFEK